MKNSKQKTLRHGSAVFTDKHCLYRIAVVRYVDSLFYEPGDALAVPPPRPPPPVPQPMLFAHRSGAVRYRKEHFPPLSALPFRPSYRCRDSSETQGAAEALCDIGQEIAGNASSGLPA